MTRRKDAKKAVRHRSPVPPPSRIMERVKRSRSADKIRLRRQVREES